MKRNLFAIVLVALVVAALVFVAAPATKAEATIHTASEDNSAIPANAGDIVNLAGKKNVTINVTGGGAIYLIDTGNVDDLTGNSAGTAILGEGVTLAEKWVQHAGGYKYLALKNEDNTYSAHPFNLSITKYGVNPTKNAIAVRATYLANDVVKELITAHGLHNLNLDEVNNPNYDKRYTSYGDYTKFAAKNGTHAYFAMEGSLDGDNVTASANLKAYMEVKIGDETLLIESNYTYELKPVDVLERVNNEYPAYTGFTKEKADILYEKDALKQYLGNLNPELYNLVNGGFENGLEGWKVVGNIGNVSADKNYWVGDGENPDGFAFGMDGEKMFSAYAPGAYEAAVGTLTSSTFKVGGSGFVTFKVGALRDGNYVYIDVVDAETKEILARYNNGLWAERTNEVKSGCTLIAYKADLSAFIGKDVFFRISDNADNNYGLFFADSFVTNYDEEPEGFNDATPVGYEVSGTIYDVANGGFERGSDLGWWNNGRPGEVTGADAFFSGVAYGKDGNFLYSGVEDHGAGNGKEGNMGTLTSSVFEIGGSGYITYMLGGGNGLCYVQVIDSTTGEILARYRQQAREDAVLKKYVADLTAYVGRTVRIQLVDNAFNDWGCVSFDNVVTYYESKPEGYMDAIDVKYQIANGSFESGMDGWKINGDELGRVIRDEIGEGWYTKNDGNKDGDHLFSFAFFDNGVKNHEWAKGNLQSNNFILKKDAYVSFRFGGAGGAQNHDVYIQLCRADGSVIATFFNDAEGKVNTRMNPYFYQYQGEETDCFFRVVDNSTGDYGCFVVDDFRVNLETAPEGFIAAIQ